MIGFSNGFKARPEIGYFGSESFVREIVEKYGQKIRYYLNHKIYGSSEQGYSLHRPEQSAKSPG